MNDILDSEREKLGMWAPYGDFYFPSYMPEHMLRRSGDFLPYHSRSHVLQMLDLGDKLFPSEMTPTLRVAITMHDVVYVPGVRSGECETLSAEMMMRAVRPDCGVDKTKAWNLIMATSIDNHMRPDQTDRDRPMSREEQIICDLDLQRLGAYWAPFVYRQFNIYTEQSGLIDLSKWPDQESHKKHAAFLQSFLYVRSSIYSTTKMIEAGYEQRARENIQRFQDITEVRTVVQRLLDEGI